MKMDKSKIDDLTSLTTERNTNTDVQPSINDGKKHAAWLITWNNYTDEDIEYFKKLMETKASKYRWQKEKGANGTPHIQGAILWKSARSFSAVKKDLPKCHIEFSKNWLAIKNYCKKSDTAEGEYGESESEQRFKFTIEDPLSKMELYQWQKDIINIIDSPREERNIYWYWDEDGCKGKTSLARHLCIHRKNVLYLCGKASDMKYGLYTAIKGGNDVKGIIVDLVRSQESFVSYQGIEELKNGIMYNTKYESEMTIYNWPHIIIFANFEPDRNRLSSDRWNIINIL